MKHLPLALLVWAIQTERMHLSVKEALSIFKQNAEGCMKTYTDPLDPEYYIPFLVGKDPIAFFIDYVLSYAKMHVVSGVRDYGKLNEDIKKYQHVPVNSLQRRKGS